MLDDESGGFGCYRHESFHLGGEEMGQTLPLQKLLFALAVAHELHFGRAAKRLNISQPYLSRSIREYEGELGFVLFRRNRRVVEVTKAGQAFLEPAKHLLVELDCVYSRSVDAARLISRQKASSLVIGYSDFVPFRLRGQVRSIQRGHFPAVHLEFRAASASEIFESIASGLFHVGITFAPLDRDDLVQIPLCSERLHAVFLRTQSISANQEIALVDLGPYPLIVPCSERTHPALRRWLLEQCAKAGFRPNIVEEISSAHNVFDLVQDGVGVAILTGEACDDVPPDLQCVPISELDPLELVLTFQSEASLQVRTVVAEIASSLRQFEHRRKIFSRTARSTKRSVVSIASRRSRTNSWKASSTA
jgi:DNA-binding transcriptional LysR family regulator